MGIGLVSYTATNIVKKQLAVIDGYKSKKARYDREKRIDDVIRSSKKDM